MSIVKFSIISIIIVINIITTFTIIVIAFICPFSILFLQNISCVIKNQVCKNLSKFPGTMRFKMDPKPPNQELNCSHACLFLRNFIIKQL